MNIDFHLRPSTVASATSDKNRIDPILLDPRPSKIGSILFCVCHAVRHLIPRDISDADTTRHETHCLCKQTLKARLHEQDFCIVRPKCCRKTQNEIFGRATNDLEIRTISKFCRVTTAFERCIITQLTRKSAVKRSLPKWTM
jgi:hypothetical protein